MTDDWVHGLAPVYGSQTQVQAARYRRLATRLCEAGARIDGFASAPGRTELAGNHTDHHRGRVLAAAVELDTVAAAARRQDGRIVLRSEGFGQASEVDLREGLEPVEGERGTTSALARGVVAAFAKRGLCVGGFDAWVASDVPVGAGLSSSAAIEVLLGTVLSGLYNDGAIAAPTLACVGQEAENRHFGKPCGLMDQMACALGGVVAIDFEHPAAPRAAQIPLDLSRFGHRLAVVDTGGSHVDLAEDYAAIPGEMRAVAGLFGREALRGLTAQALQAQAPAIRRALGDRALLRSLHFVWEDARAAEQVDALQQGDFACFLGLVRASGNSSMRWLQNVIPAGAVADQGMALALALTEAFLQGRGACRVHGGGFAGAIQVWLPDGCEDAYIALLEPIFGSGCVRPLSIRPAGAAWIPVRGMESL